MIYTDVRSRRNKDRLNKELKERYKDDHLGGHVNKKELANSNDISIAKAPNGESVIGSGLSMTSNAALNVAGHDEELIREQMARNYAFFGEDGMKRIRSSRVTIVGCGGVGSWAAIMLARRYGSQFCPG
jgi:ThiF family